LTAATESARKKLAVKSKDIILGVCVVVIIVIGQIFLFSANQKKDAALVQLRESKTELAQVKLQLDQLKNSSVAMLSVENARLRAENQKLTQKLSRLQNENRQLHGVNQEMTQQLQTTSDSEQQPAQAENQQPVATPEPSTAPEQPAAAVARLNTCINHLRQIDAAKQQWALENSKPDDAVPSALELLPYLKDAIFPMCPSGGAYTINAVGVPPTCSIPGHVLPQ
jgi:regulator of replication initiation timing